MLLERTSGKPVGNLYVNRGITGAMVGRQPFGGNRRSSLYFKLFALGLEAAIRAVWSEPAGKEIRLWNSGETWKLFDLGADLARDVDLALALRRGSPLGHELRDLVAAS